MRFELTTFCLGSKHSTTELRPRAQRIIAKSVAKLSLSQYAIRSYTPTGLGLQQFLYHFGWKYGHSLQPSISSTKSPTAVVISGLL